MISYSQSEVCIEPVDSHHKFIWCRYDMNSDYAQGRDSLRNNPNPTRSRQTLLDQIVNFDSSFIEELFPFRLFPTLRQLIDATWNCFQLRYQLFPIRFPCADSRPECNEQQRQRLLPPCVDFHGLYESERDPLAATLPAHLFMNASNTDFRQPANGSVPPTVSGQRARSAGEQGNGPQTCQCCTCRCSLRRRSSSLVSRHPQGHQRSPFSRFQPCPQHASIFAGLTGDDNNACVYTRASAVNLRVHLRADGSHEVRLRPVNTHTSCQTEVTEIPEGQLEDATCPEPCDETTCNHLLRQGVHLLQKGARLIEGDHHTMPEPEAGPSCDMLATARNLAEAVNGQLTLLKEENEMLKLANSLLHGQLADLKAASAVTDKQYDGCLSTAEDEVSRASQEIKSPDMFSMEGAPDDETSTSDECTQYPTDLKDMSTSTPEQGDMMVLQELDKKCQEPVPGTSKQGKTQGRCSGISNIPRVINPGLENHQGHSPIKCLHKQIRCLECRVETLERTCKLQDECISGLQERIHRQEIRYHETLTKFDETCRSMKVMFDGLKSTMGNFKK